MRPLIGVCILLAAAGCATPTAPAKGTPDGEPILMGHTPPPPPAKPDTTRKG